MLAVPAKELIMGKSNANLTAAALATADEYGIKPSRTVRQVRDLASLPQDVAPRKGSEGRRPTPEAKDWETPTHGPMSWGYVVQGSPKRVISLPDDRPEYWALVQGEVLLGHVRHSFAHSVGEEFDYINGRVSRVSPAAVVMRYLQRFRVVDTRVEVEMAGADAIRVSYLDYDFVARDVDPVDYTLVGSARHILERLRWISINDSCQLDDDE